MAPRVGRSEIFVLSLHRTGTQSTNDLFLRAGLRSIHWPREVAGTDFESQVVGRERDHAWIVELLSSVIAAFDAFSDVPFSTLYEELHRTYPGALFVAFHRPAEDWLRSVRHHIGSRPFDPFERVQYWHYLTDCPARLADVPDERLLDMHARHYLQIERYFKGNPGFFIGELDDAQAGENLCQSIGTVPLSLLRIDRAPRHFHEGP